MTDPLDSGLKQPGKIVTFYSYKGGTGRSLALANVAWLLAANGYRVLAIDWDLEAPGLHRYFLPFLRDPELTETRGLMDFLWDYANLVLTPRDAWPSSVKDANDLADVRPYVALLENPFVDAGGCLHFFCAGQQVTAYAARFRDFDWRAFYERQGGGAFIDALAARVREQYDFVLIDSRTGVADTSSICTVQLPDEVVLCFTYNRQNVKGVAAVARSIRDQRDPALPIWPVPMRVEKGVEGLNEARDFARDELDRFLPVDWPADERAAYWNSCEISYYPDYAFGETLAVFRDRPQTRSSLVADMKWLASRLLPPDRELKIPSLDPEKRETIVHRYRLGGLAKAIVSRADAVYDTLERIDQRRGALLTIRQLQADAQHWLSQDRNPSYQWSHERVREAVAALRQVAQEVRLGKEEEEFLGPIDPEQMLAELERPETSHRRRALIGERLAILSEPPSRWGVGVDERGTPKIDWRPVPRGKVTISILSDPNNRDSKVKHTLPKTIKTFHIARFPITVGQYRAFIEAEDGWRDGGWWRDDLYRDEDGNTYDFGRFGNHPALFVSWFDAMAFCRWLTRRLCFEVRLPDEWEWQQAATGGDEGNVFPWGAEWDAKKEPWRANTFESRLGQATAVGMYPAGASPTGILDMAGTVWEWCLNKVEEPEERRSRADNSDPRALRGGSWLSDRVDARSAYRVRNKPLDRSLNVGFRVMCSSPCDL